MARKQPQQPRRQRSPHNPAGRLPLLLRWVLVPMAGSLAFASISPPRDAGLMTIGASSGGGRIRIGRMGAAPAASLPSAGVPRSFWAPRVGLRLQGGRDGGVEVRLCVCGLIGWRRVRKDP